jgi:methylenetetrahydrofolate reductase (NADPH)
MHFSQEPTMLIRDLFDQKKRTLSFEVFPPVREGNLESLFQTISELKELKPDFISVTYGAGGGTRDKTIEIASRVKTEIGSEALAHLTCVAATREDIARIVGDMKEQHIENILALRGDPPKGESTFVKPAGGFGFASELVAFIKEHNGFSIGVAGYPEGHPEASSFDDDMKNLKRKVDAGADFIVTQLFFNNDDFYRFRDRALALKIGVPIIPGIFPILNYKQVLRITELCGAKIPSALGEKLCWLKDKPEDVEKYGIEYAQKQARDLLHNEVRGLHICTMNQSRAARKIVRELGL